ncbi:ornithine decarboxylase 2-like [Phymastichus coffea]|uniref:ornithine decarboxylase 2-like n=1 Tax=Phymastichus coffea TaxID=108790 RepID=UPI00273AB171|nr:ornithine decarboxylase 2-like [Phymastichus coffea]
MTLSLFPSRFPSDFDEVRIFDDKLDDLEIMRKIIALENLEDPFHLFDVADLVSKHKTWIERIPRVVPHYAVKCNPNPTVIKTLAALGASFDCASKQEIVNVMAYGVPANKIIFANPVKTPSQILYARKIGVARMTVDSMWELRKIKELYPEAKIIIRFRNDAAVSDVYLGTKFGCDPGEEAVRLIRGCRDLGLELHGFSFHVGSPCGEVTALSRGIGICKYLIDVAHSYGLYDVQLIDIGGGIPGDSEFLIDEFADVINEALRDIDPSIRVISEPGQYYVCSAFKAVAFLHGKRIVVDKGCKKRMYYVNDGVNGSFWDELVMMKARLPKVLNKPHAENEKKHLSTLWGPTCDSYDCIAKDVMLPELEIGDWLYWKDMGAYTTCLSTNFNGFTPPVVYPIMRRSAWNSFLAEIHKDDDKPVVLTQIDENGNLNYGSRGDKCDSNSNYV